MNVWLEVTNATPKDNAITPMEVLHAGAMRAGLEMVWSAQVTNILMILRFWKYSLSSLQVRTTTFFATWSFTTGQQTTYNWELAT